MASRKLQRKVRKPKSQERRKQLVRDDKKKGPESRFKVLRNKIARRRERLSLLGRARRIIGARKFAAGGEKARELARRNRSK